MALGQPGALAAASASDAAGKSRKPPRPPVADIPHEESGTAAETDQPRQEDLNRAPSSGDDEVVDSPLAEDRIPEAEQVGQPGEAVPHQPATHDTIRLNVALIDRLMATAGELVLGRNQLCRLLEDRADESSDLAEVLQHLSQVTSDIQEHTMGMRMQQLAKVFGRLPRLVRDSSRRLGVEVTPGNQWC